jgi:hypothetical protein
LNIPDLPDWAGQIAAMFLVFVLTLWLANVPSGDEDD